MIATIGDLGIYIGTIGLFISTFLYLLAWRGAAQYRKHARLAYNVSAVAIIVSTAALFDLIISHDFSVSYVAQYSSRDLPLLFLISSFWAGQLGTFLLWLAMLSVCGMILTRSHDKLRDGVMTIVSLVGISLIVILIKKSPFEILPVAPLDGSGLNPLLQDFWMAIHPPIMFIGFATAAVPFAYGMSSLISRDYSNWESASRNWTIVAWLTIGISLMMGGYWAYKVLGWGGYWAWDPVENASLIPWLLLTAQLHVLALRRGGAGMRRFSYVAVSLSFLSVLYGTFLTRSGVLADFSVHSFVDLGLNSFLIGSLLFFSAMTVIAIAMRWPEVTPPEKPSSVSSMAYMVTLGVVLLFVGAILTLGGTSAPLLTRFTETPSAVEISYYIATMTPIALLTLLLLAIFPFFKWTSGITNRAGLASGFGIFIVSVLVMKFGIGVESLWYATILASGIWALYSNLWQFRVVMSQGRLPAAPIIHIGLALALIGATASSGMEQREKFTLTQGEPQVAFGTYQLTFTGYESFGLDTTFAVAVSENVGEAENEKGSFVASLRHINKDPDAGVVRKPYIDKSLWMDVYISPLGSRIGPPPMPSGKVELLEGEQVNIGEYSLTLLRTEALRKSPSSPATKLTAVLEARRSSQYGETIETLDLRPSLSMVGGELHTHPAFLPDSSGSIEMILEQAPRGGTVFAVSGGFLVPEMATSVSADVLAVEISTKPLISLLWIGSVLVFLGGGLALTIKPGKRTDSHSTTHTASSPAVPNNREKQLTKERLKG